MNRTSSFLWADLAICLMCGIEDRLDVPVMPSMFIISGGITEPSVEIGKLLWAFGMEIGRN